jgi:hypothetical protein
MVRPFSYVRSMGAHLKPEPITVRGTCIVCKERPQQAKGGGKYRATCSTCHRGGDMQRRITAKRVAGQRALILEAKAAGCSRCPETHPAALDFHHVDGAEKLFMVCIANTRPVAKAKLKAEMAKCVILCANCHRKEHWVEDDPLAPFL